MPMDFLPKYTMKKSSVLNKIGTRNWRVGPAETFIGGPKGNLICPSLLNIAPKQYLPLLKTW